MPSMEMVRWVKSAAESVTAYFGRFPVPQLLIRITPFKGRGVRNGRTFGDRGGRITIRVGDETSPAELASDWMLTHEMVHLAFPSVDENHHWIEEGIATYVEPIARIRAGHLTAEQMWLELVRDMPQGLPQAGDRGLVDAGGDIRKEWNLEDALRAGDRAVGVAVLQPLYVKMKDAPPDVDLNSLWTQLGVQSDGTSVRFDDSATLAAIRRAITAPASNPAAAVEAGLTVAAKAGRCEGRPIP